ncbi:hypothetical protein BXZ70DRAFT_1069255 [Cristinia sonorae]|uniref:NAD(P)-binding protein n=1 Tax=Cristinia sonorae TaxID=1940300 RepID=A0A8K0V2K2_9AGAR|nr:hypothetical protein BXZ70DRAFT_1069255 [Cristinia sonorae]
MAPKVWLVTGAASGIGLETTKHLLEQGDSVVATDIKLDGLADLKSKFSSNRLLVKTLNLDVVFSNAGYALSAELEGVPEDIARELFDVNFWGSAAVGRAGVKYFRESGNGGKVLFTSSMLGIITFPIVGIYSSAKHALEGYVQTLASELDPKWNIKLTLIEPAIFRTNIVANTVLVPPIPAYNRCDLPSAAVRQLLLDPNMGNNPTKGAKQIIRVAELEQPPLRLALGKDALTMIEAQVTSVLAGLKEYTSWSNNLEFDG